MNTRPGRKAQISEEINSMKKLKNFEFNDETFEDFNPLELMPEIIDKDYGFFLMFGRPDNPSSRTLSTNYDSVRSIDVNSR